MRRDGIRPVAEALGFTLAVALYIWFLRAKWPWSILVLIALVLASLIWHSETFDSLGLTVRAFVAAISSWRWGLVAALTAMAILGIIRAVPAHLAYRWFVYLAWCFLQQLILQNMVYRRLRADLGSSWRTSLFAGGLFAALHIPNPVLVPATFLWGTISTRLFEARPSVPFLGLSQALLSALVYMLTPVTLNRLFRVGPGYWAW
jgi:hypothetical protein